MADLEAPLDLPVSTTFDVPGRTVSAFVGPVFGVLVRSTGAAGNIKGTFRAFKHGEVEEFTEAVEEARRIVLERLVEHARGQGAHAVVGLQFHSTDLGGQGVTELVAYGTAVTLE